MTNNSCKNEGAFRYAKEVRERNQSMQVKKFTNGQSEIKPVLASDPVSASAPAGHEPDCGGTECGTGF